MASPEDIPEDKCISIPCECGGNIILNSNSLFWECDTCNFSRPDKTIKKEKGV